MRAKQNWQRIATCLVLVMVLANIGPLAMANSFDLSGKIKWHVQKNVAQWSYAHQLRALYSDRDYAPIWFDDNGLNNKGRILLNHLRNASEEGLDADDYHYADISSLIERGDASFPELELVLTSALFNYANDIYLGRKNLMDVDQSWHISMKQPNMTVLLGTLVKQSDFNAALDSLAPPSQEYRNLRATLKRYQRIAREGGWPGVSYPIQLKPGWRNEQVPQIRETLRMMGDLTDRGAPSDSNYYDESLRQAVIRFQRRHGLRADGVIGTKTIEAMNVPVTDRIRQIQVNMERWRWMPRSMEQRYVLVNIPEFKLRLYQTGRPVEEHSVIVGKEYRASPVLKSSIQKIVLNPYWNVPTRIAREDLLKTIKKDNSFFDNNGIEVFSGGKKISSTAINWNRYNENNLPYTLRQKPGEKNALGRIKFIFPNKYDVYLHDTPSRYLFKYDTRMFSSGCIRAEDPVKLAASLLDDGMNAAEIDAQIDKGRTEAIPLAKPVSIYVSYFTARADADGTLHFFRDVYDRDKTLLKRFPGFHYGEEPMTHVVDQNQGISSRPQM